jgi:hypothetical protein
LSRPAPLLAGEVTDVHANDEKKEKKQPDGEAKLDDFMADMRELGAFDS